MTPRKADHPVAAQFLNRWSPRAFDGTVLTEADVLSLLEAARWAPSASNHQPWRFVWALQGDPGFEAISAALAHSNRIWASLAAALIVVASKTTLTRPEGEVANSTHAFDAGAAWAQLGLQAHLNGFFAHAMGGFDHPALTTGVRLPANHALHAVVAVGRHGDPASLPEALRPRETPNGRVPLTDLARRGTF